MSAGLAFLLHKAEQAVLCNPRLFSTMSMKRTCPSSPTHHTKSLISPSKSRHKLSFHERRSFSGSSTARGDVPNSNIIKSAKALSFVVVLSMLGGLQYFLVLRHLEKVPQTGRWRKMNITPEIEAQLGEEAYNSLGSQYKDSVIPDNHPVSRYVHQIVNALLGANDLGTVVSANDTSVKPSFPHDDHRRSDEKSHEDRRWRLAVIMNDQIANSTASTGGIVVFTGLLLLCKDEHELAAILGHEIGHVVARHLAERYSKAKDWSLKQLLLGPSSNLQKQQHVQGEFQQMMATNLHVQELEADAIGLELSARACFDPQAAVDVNQRLTALEEKFRRLHPELRPTHPCSAERIKQLKQILPGAYETMSKSPKCSKMQKALAAFHQAPVLSTQ